MIYDQHATARKRKLAVLREIELRACVHCYKPFLPSQDEQGALLCPQCIADNVVLINMKLQLEMPLEYIHINLKINDTGVEFEHQST